MSCAVAMPTSERRRRVVGLAVFKWAALSDVPRFCGPVDGLPRSPSCVQCVAALGGEARLPVKVAVCHGGGVEAAA